MERMDMGSIILGIFPNLKVEKQLLHYNESSTIMLYTDGLIELLNPVINDAINTIENTIVSEPNNVQLIEEIKNKFVNGKALKDDICLISMNVK